MGFKFCSALSSILAVCLAATLISGLNGQEPIPSADMERHFQASSTPRMRRVLPCTKLTPCTVHMIADLDHGSRVGDEKKPAYKSELLSGKLTVDNVATNKVAVNIDWFVKEPLEIVGKFAEEGRGMELSELVMFNDSLFAFDDRTGIIYELLARSGDAHLRGSIEGLRTMFEDLSVRDLNETQAYLSKVKIDPVAKALLTEGDGETSPKGMKVEWACEKDGRLYVGSFGKEYTTSDGSEILSTSNLWIAIVDNPHLGQGIQRVDWTRQYDKLREAVGCHFPGYLIHEAVNWSSVQRKWYFLPRRVSAEAYDVVKDEKRGSNKILIADENFDKIVVKEVKYPVSHPDRGFSSFKFMPGTDDKLIIALRSAEEESKGRQETYLSVFTTDGDIILDEILVSGHQKYEGLEIW